MVDSNNHVFSEIIPLRAGGSSKADCGRKSGIVPGYYRAGRWVEELTSRYRYRRKGEEERRKVNNANKLIKLLRSTDQGTVYMSEMLSSVER